MRFFKVRLDVDFTRVGLIKIDKINKELDAFWINVGNSNIERQHN